jgi:hypothetical protein
LQALQLPQDQDWLHRWWPEQVGMQRWQVPLLQTFSQVALKPSSQVLRESGQKQPCSSGKSSP